MTYEWFVYVMAREGYNVDMKDEYILIKDGITNIAEVSRVMYGGIDTCWRGFENLSEKEQKFVVDTCWELARTELSERKRQDEDVDKLEKEQK